MGCDIHMHAEIKVKGKWLHYDQPDCDRNYQLFEKMAGVRGEDSEAISPPRGIPEDVAETTRFVCEEYGSDGHSHSWLGATEIAELREWWDSQPYGKNGSPTWDQWFFGNYYSGFVKYPDERPDEVEDVRFVFWFDN